MHGLVATGFEGLKQKAADELLLTLRLSAPFRMVERKSRVGVRRYLVRLLKASSICSVFLFLTRVLLVQAADGSNLTTNVSTHLVGNGTKGPYHLGDQYIVDGTAKISKHGVPLEPNRDFFLDRDQGLLTFSADLLPQDTVDIDYVKLDLSLKKKYFHRELVYAGNDIVSGGFGSSGGGGSAEQYPSSISRGKIWGFASPKSGSDLVLSGSKTFSLDVGSAQDLSLKQGLWLSANGKASQNLDISLQVSDQNMPATTEGTTKKLDELDKVQILVSSPHFSGTLGDYYLQPSVSELFAYNKKLKGVTAEAKSGRSSAFLALASSKGESFTNKFPGEDNKQGPYQLKGKNGESDLMVLPGTEKVWVDGEEMQRGSDNDYIIDYGRGAIQFTPRRLITSESRIAVDFEYSMENYQRDLYSGNVMTSFLGGKAELKAGGMLEKDDAGHPSSFTPSTEDKSILSLAGDDRLSASKDGAVRVGEGKGDYELAHDTSGSLYYRYVGSDSGSYTVTFSWVGGDKGSYQYRGGGVYQYVYPDHGDFLPVVLLPLPESHSLFDLNLSVSPLNNLKTQVEWAGSERDGNTLSQKDDEHNWGDAVFLKSAYRNSDFKFLTSSFRRLELGGEYSLTKKDFAPFGRMDQVEKERTWGSAQNPVPADERTYRFNGVISPSPLLLLDFDYGELKREKDFSSHRGSLGAEISPLSWMSAKARSERINTIQAMAESLKEQTRWTRNSVVLSGRVRRLSTSLSWNREERRLAESDTSDQGDRFDQLDLNACLDWSNALKTNTEFSYRQDDQLEDRWLSKSYSYVWSGRLSLRDYAGMLSSDLEGARRVKKYRQSLTADNKENLLSARVDLYPKSQLFTLRAYHSQNQVYSQGRLDTYTEVEDGKGDYRYENGEYYPSPEGNFVRVSEWVGETQPSLDLNRSIRLIFSPNKVSSLKGGKSFWTDVGRIFSSDSFINLRGTFTDDKSPGFYLLYPLTKLSTQSILSQNTAIRQDLYLLPNCRSLNFQLRWEQSKDENRLVSNGARQEDKSTQEVLAKSLISSGYVFESKFTKEKVGDDWGGAPEDRIQGSGLRLTLTRRQSQTLELGISGEWRERQEKIQRTKVEFFSLSPEFLWSLLLRGRLKAELEWTHLRSVPGNRDLSYVLTEGKRRGENYTWHFSFDYKLNQYLSSSAVYSGESMSDERTKHTGSMELKAYF
ncbi:MAG: hypothetical protein WCE90_11880 [Candidatus Zixiibacteriota bacterium]